MARLQHRERWTPRGAAPGRQRLNQFEGMDALEATVCWVCGFEGGLEFDRPIHPAVFDRLIAKLIKYPSGPLACRGGPSVRSLGLCNECHLPGRSLHRLAAN